MLITWDDILLCPWSAVLIMCLISLQFENIDLRSFLASCHCCVFIGSDWSWLCFFEFVCAKWGEGGEILKLQFGLITVHTTFIMCQVVKLTIAYKNSLESLLPEMFPTGKDCSHIHWNGERARTWIESQCFSCRSAFQLFLGKVLITLQAQFSHL